MFHHIFQWRNVIIYFCHRLVVPEVDVSCLPVALFGYDDHSQSFCRIPAFLVDGDALLCRTVEQHYDIRILLDSPALT